MQQGLRAGLRSVRAEPGFCGKTGAGTAAAPFQGLTSFGDDEFNSCTSLASITIPNAVTSIGNYAFSD
ncbi:MAG: leucine-rich repeat protein, partial [Treponema sp.]|nr:leucine-rich repeat protein [Treponema sp.]